MKHKGFTIVELVIVLVVIAILSTIGIVSYSYMRDDGMDTKIRSIVKTVGDAIQLYESQQNTQPSGQGYFTNTNGIDALVPQFLQSGYRDGIKKTKHADYAHQVFRWYKCPSGGFAIYASLNNPTDEDKQQLQSIKSKCNHDDVRVPVTGKPAYNYAQAF